MLFPMSPWVFSGHKVGRRDGIRHEASHTDCVCLLRSEGAMTCVQQQEPCPGLQSGLPCLVLGLNSLSEGVLCNDACSILGVILHFHEQSLSPLVNHAELASQTTGQDERSEAPFCYFSTLKTPSGEVHQNRSRRWKVSSGAGGTERGGD